MRVSELKKQVLKTENSQNLLWFDGEGWTFPSALKDFEDLTSSAKWGWYPNGSAQFGQGPLTFTQIEPFDGTGAATSFSGGDFGERMNPYGFSAFATIGGSDFGWSDATGSKQIVVDRVIGYGDGAEDTFTLYVGTAAIEPDSLVIKHTLTTVKTGTSSSGAITGANIASGTVDEVTGSIAIVFTAAPDIGTEITASYVVDSYMGLEEVEILAIGNNVTTNFTTLKTRYGIIRDHSVRIKTKIGGNDILLVDDGAGSLVELDGNSGMTSGTINETTGAIAIDFATAPGDGEQISITYCRKGLNHSTIDYATGGTIGLRFDVGSEPDNGTKVVLIGGTFAIQASAGMDISTGIIAIGKTGSKAGFRSARSYREIGAEDYSDELATLVTSPGSRHTLSFYGKVTSTTGKCYIRAWDGLATNTQISFGPSSLEWAALTGAVTRVADPLDGTKFCLQCDITTALQRFGAYILVPIGAYCVSMEWEGDTTNTYLGEQTLWVSGIQWSSGTELGAYSPNTAVYAALLPSADPLGMPGYVLSTDGAGNTTWIDPSTAAAAGIAQINGLSAASQTITMGSTGTAPAISSSGSTHQINIPYASNATVTGGLLGKADYDAFKAYSSGTASSDFLPTVDDTYDLGSSSKRWAELHATSAYINIIGSGTNTVYDGGATKLSKYIDGLGGLTLGYNAYSSNISGAVRSDSNKAGWLMEANSNTFSLSLTKETTATNVAGDNALTIAKSGATTIGRTGSAWAANRLTDIGVTLTHPILSDLDKNFANPGYDPLTGPLLTIRGTTTGTGKGSVLSFARAESGTLPIAGISAVTAAPGSGLSKLSFMGSTNDTTWPTEIASVDTTGKMTVKSLSVDGVVLTKDMVTHPGALPSTNDGKQYLAKNGAWIEMTGGGGSSQPGVLPSTNDNKQYVAKNGLWAELVGGGGISHATSNGKMYGSKDNDWAEITKSTIGLSNVDNTADSNKTVAASLTLSASPKINGITFTGASDITIPSATPAANTLTLPVMTGMTVTAGNVVEIVETPPTSLSATPATYCRIVKLSDTLAVAYYLDSALSSAKYARLVLNSGIWELTESAVGTYSNMSAFAFASLIRLSDTTAICVEGDGSVRTIDLSGAISISASHSTVAYNPYQLFWLSDGQLAGVCGSTIETIDFGNPSFSAKSIPMNAITSSGYAHEGKGAIFSGDIFVFGYCDSTDSKKFKAKVIDLSGAWGSGAVIATEYVLGDTGPDNYAPWVAGVALSTTTGIIACANGDAGTVLYSKVTLSGTALTFETTENTMAGSRYKNADSLYLIALSATNFLSAFSYGAGTGKGWYCILDSSNGACNIDSSIQRNSDSLQADEPFLTGTSTALFSALGSGSVEIYALDFTGGINIEGPGAFVGGPFALGNTTAIQDLQIRASARQIAIYADDVPSGKTAAVKISDDRVLVAYSLNTSGYLALTLFDTSGDIPRSLKTEIATSAAVSNIFATNHHRVTATQSATHQVIAYISAGKLYSHVVDCIGDDIMIREASTADVSANIIYAIGSNMYYAGVVYGVTSGSDTEILFRGIAINDSTPFAALFTAESLATLVNSASVSACFSPSLERTYAWNIHILYKANAGADLLYKCFGYDNYDPFNPTLTEAASSTLAYGCDATSCVMIDDRVWIMAYSSSAGTFARYATTDGATLGTLSAPITLSANAALLYPPHQVSASSVVIPYGETGTNKTIVFAHVFGLLDPANAAVIPAVRQTQASQDPTENCRWVSMCNSGPNRVFANVSHSSLMHIASAVVDSYGFAWMDAKPLIQGSLLGIATTTGGGSNPATATVNVGNFSISGLTGLTGGKDVYVAPNGVGLSHNCLGKDYLVGLAVSKSRIVVKL